MKPTGKSWRLIVMVALAAVALSAAPKIIGVATGTTQFLIDRTPVSGNATLFEGATVETRAGSSKLLLEDGAQMQLDPQSRGRIYKDRLVLERGSGRLVQGPSGTIEARQLQVLSASGNGHVLVKLGDKGQVQVAASNGTAEVKTAGGLLLARLNAGGVLTFEPQAATAMPPYQVEGCLLAREGAFLLDDVTSNVRFELRGENLAQYSGRYVQITASQWPNATPAANASQVLRVAQVKVLPVGCPLAADRSGPQPRQQSTVHKAAGHTKAIVAGVAIAGGVAAATMGLTGDEEPATISR